MPRQAENVVVMIELMRTNDPVLISFVEALLRDAGLHVFVADQNMSVIEGSLGVLPRRVMIADDDLDRARRVMTEAGMEGEINPK